MKVIKYNICNEANIGTDENPQMKEFLLPVTLGWNETNEETAKKEAYNGEYTIEDDGRPEPEPTPSTEELEAEIEDMQTALGVLGVTV